MGSRQPVPCAGACACSVVNVFVGRIIGNVCDGSMNAQWVAQAGATGVLAGLVRLQCDGRIASALPG